MGRGLSHSFNYNAMQVGYSTLPSNNEAKKAVLIQLLAEHPEGIVLYDRRQPHAVLLTDYTDGVFYCSDPAGSVSSGRVPISAASISIAGASCYWYISSDHNSAVATLDSLRLEGMRYPVNIRTGKGHERERHCRQRIGCCAEQRGSGDPRCQRPACSER